MPPRWVIRTVAIVGQVTGLPHTTDRAPLGSTACSTRGERPWFVTGYQNVSPLFAIFRFFCLGVGRVARPRGTFLRYCLFGIYDGGCSSCYRPRGQSDGRACLLALTVSRNVPKICTDSTVSDIPKRRIAAPRVTHLVGACSEAWYRIPPPDKGVEAAQLLQALVASLTPPTECERRTSRYAWSCKGPVSVSSVDIMGTAGGQGGASRCRAKRTAGCSYTFRGDSEEREQ